MSDKNQMLNSHIHEFKKGDGQVLIHVFSYNKEIFDELNGMIGEIATIKQYAHDKPIQPATPTPFDPMSDPIIKELVEMEAANQGQVVHSVFPLSASFSWRKSIMGVDFWEVVWYDYSKL